MITHLLAVDGGGTKTALRLTTLEPLKTDPFFTLTSGPSSLTQQGSVAIATIKHAIEHCLNQCQLKADNVFVAIGVAGAGNQELKQQLQDSLVQYPYCLVTTDAHISLLGAKHGESVNTIAIGTGAVATTLESNGEISLFGGWGFPIGDEAGGAWLGQQAVRALIDAIETQKHSPLTNYLANHFGQDRKSLLQWLKQAKAADYAQFAPVVIEYGEQDCGVSQSILAEAHRHIDNLITKCCKNNELDIAFLGSLGAYYQAHLQAHWQHRVIQPKGTALDGAILLAKQQVELINE